MNPLRIIVTGEHDDLQQKIPTELGHNGFPLEWISVPVLRFEKLTVSSDRIQSALDPAPDWTIFTSRRTIHFFTQCLLEHGIDFPVSVRVGCIGARTAEAANLDGFTPDFCPEKPGSEAFLEAFERILDEERVQPTIFLPVAEGGRTLIATRLSDRGCEVRTLPLYRSEPRTDMHRHLSDADLATAALVIFTSPSSVDAFTGMYTIPENVKIAAIGSFTAEHLKRRGYADLSVLPDGDFERVGEVL